MNNQTPHSYCGCRRFDHGFQRTAATLWVALMILEIGLGDISSVFAQRRRAEPEANPEFQNEVQDSQAPKGGEPVIGAQESAPATPASSSPKPEPGPAGATGASQEPEMMEDTAAARPRVPSVQIGATPEAVETAPVPKNPMETRVTVRVKEAPLATFLDTISAQAKVNFIITEGLREKRVTAFLQSVTVREALQILLEIKGLTYRQVGKSNTYIVTTRSRSAPNRITRIYTLSYISLIPILASNASSSSGSQLPVIVTGGSQSGGGSAGASGGLGGAGGQQGADKEGAISIIAIMKSVLSKDGTMAIDPRSNSIIITDIPEIFPQVEQILVELDRKIPQLMIEAQIVEIDSDKAQNLGIEWGGPQGELATFTGGARDTSFPLNLGKELSNAHFFGPVTQVVSPIQGNAGDATLTGTTIRNSIVDFGRLTVLLKALVTRSQARFLGKPKVLTLNNKTATIQITQDQAIGLAAVAASAGGGGGSVGVATQSVERYTTGLTLNVTPQVNKEGYITMLIQPNYTSVIGSAITQQGQPVFDPIIRTASSMVRVRNGQTMVLGGLLSSRESRVVRKVPLLGYIPILGWLFTSVSTQRNNTDLVIFLTPTIVKD